MLANDPEKSISPLLVVLAVATFAGAINAVLLALGEEVACEFDCGLSRAQWLLALAGLIPVTIMIVAVALKRRRLAHVAFAAALCTYVVWGVLTDAAAHGWGKDMWLVP